MFGRFTSQERTNVHRTAFFLHTPDFSLSKVTALKVVWGKDTSRRSKEPGSDLPSCFSAWAPFCKCGWRHHISRSGCGLDWFSYPVFWNRKAVIRLVIFSFNLSWIDIVKKRKVICMLNYLTKCWTPFLGQRFLKLDFCISDTPHSPRALVYYLTRPKVRLFSIRSTLLLQLICQHSGSALMNTKLLRVWRSLFA